MRYLGRVGFSSGATWWPREYRRKQGLRVDWVHALSYFTVVLVIGQAHIWILIGWGWRWGGRGL